MTPNTPTPSATAPAGQVHTATPWHVAIDDQGNGTQRVMIRAPHVAGGDEDIAVMLRVVNQSKHANASHIVHCVNTHSQLLAQNAALRAAIDSALEYFEDREDVVDGSYGESAPNKEMALAQELRTAIGVSP